MSYGERSKTVNQTDNGDKGQKVKNFIDRVRVLMEVP
jgi:hypothetical protein